MNKLLLFLLFALLAPASAWGQDLSVEIISRISCPLTDGVYLNHKQFVTNQPIPFNSIAADGNLIDYQFISKCLSQTTLTYFDSLANIKKVKISSVWGYSSSCNVFINAGGAFLIIPKLETISLIPEKVPEKWFIDRIETDEELSTFEDENYQTVNSLEMIVDLRSGIIHRFEPKTLTELFASDSALRDEYQSLCKRKQKRRKLQFLNRFNQRNPLNLHK